jgi:hypothetical protein
VGALQSSHGHGCIAGVLRIVINLNDCNSTDAELLREHERVYGPSELLHQQVRLYGWSELMA